MRWVTSLVISAENTPFLRPTHRETFSSVHWPPRGEAMAKTRPLKIGFVISTWDQLPRSISSRTGNVRMYP